MVNNKNQVINNDQTMVPKKRGRKSKKVVEAVEVEELTENFEFQNNINVVIDDPDKGLDNIDELLNSSEMIDEIIDNENVDNNFLSFDNNIVDNKPVPKKRGRKPKGGKIIQQSVSFENDKIIKPNVILHLKCSIKDLLSKSLTNTELQSFNFSNTNQLSYGIINENNQYNNQSNNQFINQYKKIEEPISTIDEKSDKEYEDYDCEDDVKEKEPECI